jgi:hypothetical protein
LYIQQSVYPKRREITAVASHFFVLEMSVVTAPLLMTAA